MLKAIYSLVLIVCFSIDISSQKLDHVLGEILIQIPDGHSINGLKRKLRSKMSNVKEIRFEQLIAKPMNIWTVKVDPNSTNENTLLNHLKSIDVVLNAQKNHITSNRLTPNDTRFNQQWQYLNDGTLGVENADLDMDLAWEITTGGITAHGDTIVVCIVDDGLNIDHPDMQGNIWTNHDEIPDNNIDDDNNGYIDDYYGWNAINNNGSINQNGIHGTPVTGIIGAKGNNELGVTGINWDVKTMMVVGGSPESTAIASYAYAYSQRKRYNESNGAEGAFVVATNSSWGINRGQPEEAPLWCDFYDILGSEGILSCGATANRDFNIDIEGDLPTACASPYLISVTNINRTDNKVNQAGYGLKTIDIGAYGEDAYTLTNSNYSSFGGTSSATPHVAGVIALAYAIDCPEFIELVKTSPDLTALAVKDMILLGSTYNESLEGITVSNGRLNANNSLENLLTLCNEECTEAFGVNAINIGIFETQIDNFKSSNQGNINIRYRVAGTDSWTEISNQSLPFEISNLQSCTSYEFQTASICSDTLGSFGYIKDFKTLGCCESPSIIDITIEEDIATVSWTSTVAADQYTIEYKELSSNEWISLEVDEEIKEITIPNIDECTIYEVRVKATCNISGRESEFYQTTFSGECGNCTADYCEIEAKNTIDEWIASVSIDGIIENMSGNDGGYGAYIGAYDIQLKRGQSYQMTLTPGYTSTPFTEYFEVYLDANQDGQFSESELLLANEQGVESAYTDQFSVLPESLLGITRLRIIMRYNLPNNSSCDNPDWEYGEFEDYCVEILEGDSECPEQLEIISEIDSTENSLSFLLTDNTFISTYIVKYRKEGESDYTISSFNLGAISLEGLDKCSEYELTYKGVCSDGLETMESLVTLKTKCSLSIIEDYNSKIIISPNPSTGLIEIETPDDFKITSVRIIDIDGKEVFTSNEKSFRVNNLVSSGVYFIQISGKENVVVRKWVKI